LEALQSAFYNLDHCVQNGDLGVDEDDRFHGLICEASDNHYFTTVWTSLRDSIRTGMNLTRNLSLSKSPERLRLVQTEHSRIMEAITAQDPEAAQAAMRPHIENARRRVFDGSL
jgi:DNA-binding FadR family transcriptional regulator